MTLPKADFSGYVTKANLKCSDGRTIMPEAFQHMDGKTVPLVWQHGHNSPENVLGHAILEARPDGVYGYGYFVGITAYRIAFERGGGRLAVRLPQPSRFQRITAVIVNADARARGFSVRSLDWNYLTDGLPFEVSGELLRR